MPPTFTLVNAVSDYQSPDAERCRGAEMSSERASRHMARATSAEDAQQTQLLRVTGLVCQLREMQERYRDPDRSEQRLVSSAATQHRFQRARLTRARPRW